MEMPQTYDQKASEKKWKETWEKHNSYAFDPTSKKPVYSIDTPPPTVSGAMHIGHSFSYAQQDFIARFKRMTGHNVFYPFGTDDNGLPTDKLVEKTKQVKAKKMTRSEYLTLAHTTIQELRPAFIDDWKVLGMSCDFSQPYSTISPSVQKTAQKGFLDLYKKGLVYRKETPVSWCPLCQTAIAQAEFENVEMSSHFNDIIFKSGEQELVIATTRPELLPSCVALFFHPDDQRYRSLKGKFAKVPLFDYEVPILEDATVDKEKGTGLMMCCTFGDKEDIEKWHKYHLPLRVSFTLDGKMNESTGKYAGLQLREARKEIIKDLEAQALLLVSKPITHPVNVHERDGVEVEYMVTPQWYVNVLDHKEELIKAADSIKWHPQHMKSRYTHWVENLGWDWCISRQRHFGIPFPVWYEKDTGNIILADESQLPVDPLKDLPKGYSKIQLIPETDVLDTWATSSLSPQIALNWSEEKNLMNHFPMDIRPQAHDIIRTWAFYTITRGVYHQKTVPWKNIMISGFVLDPRGNKMSKSKGNVIKPQEVMDKYSSDALRYWAAGSRLGDDLPYMEKDVKTGQKTVTKLWNACKFSLSHLKNYDGSKPRSLVTVDSWLLSELSKVIVEATESFNAYSYAKAKQVIDNFFWNTYCDYYLEIIKDRAYNTEAYTQDQLTSLHYTIETAIQSILKLFAPFMPFITEEIWQFMKRKESPSIHHSTWPSVMDHNNEALESGALLVSVISAVRKVKSEANVSLKTSLTSLTITCTPTQKKALEKVLGDINAVTGAVHVELVDGKEFSVQGVLASQ